MWSSASARRSSSSSLARRPASASSMARASSLRNVATRVPSSWFGVVVDSGDTTWSLPPGAVAESRGRVSGVGTEGVGVARPVFRYLVHAECCRCTSAIAAFRLSGPISLRVGMRRIVPALRALTLLNSNASGFACSIASIIRWTLTDLSGRMRAAIDQSVSDFRIGPYSTPLDAGVASEVPASGAGCARGVALPL